MQEVDLVAVNLRDSALFRNVDLYQGKEVLLADSAVVGGLALEVSEEGDAENIST